MARNEATQTENTENGETKTKRRNTGPRPLHVLYKTGTDGELEIVTVTRDANEVIDSIQGDPSLKHKKVDAKIGR